MDRELGPAGPAREGHRELELEDSELDDSGAALGCRAPVLAQESAPQDHDVQARVQDRDAQDQDVQARVKQTQRASGQAQQAAEPRPDQVRRADADMDGQAQGVAQVVAGSGDALCADALAFAPAAQASGKSAPFAYGADTFGGDDADAADAVDAAVADALVADTLDAFALDGDAFARADEAFVDAHGAHGASGGDATVLANGSGDLDHGFGQSLAAVRQGQEAHAPDALAHGLDALAHGDGADALADGDGAVAFAGQDALACQDALGDPDAFGGADALGKGQDAFGEGGDAFGEGEDAFGEGEDAFGAVEDAFGEGGDAFGEGEDAFGAVEDAFGEGRDAFCGEGEDAFGGEGAFGQGDDGFGEEVDAFGEAWDAGDGWGDVHNDAGLASHHDPAVAPHSSDPQGGRGHVAAKQVPSGAWGQASDSEATCDSMGVAGDRAAGLGDGEGLGAEGFLAHWACPPASLASQPAPERATKWREKWGLAQTQALNAAVAGQGGTCTGAQACSGSASDAAAEEEEEDEFGDFEEPQSLTQAPGAAPLLSGAPLGLLSVLCRMIVAVVSDAFSSAPLRCLSLLSFACQCRLCPES